MMKGGRFARNLRWALPIACALLGACVMVMACGTLAACSEHNSPADAAAPAASASSAATALMREGASIAVPEASPLRNALQVSAVAQTTFERPIRVPGVIEADASRLVKIVPPVGGRIERVYKNLGDSVRAGEPLLMLDSPELAQASSDAAKAQAALALAQHNLTRQQDLSAAEISAKKDLEQAQSDEVQARSEARRAQSRLTQLGATSGRGDGRQYTLNSPISGHVIELTGAQGGFWNDTNAPLMTVADLSKVWLTASVQEKDLATLFVGQQARIVLDAYPDEPATGQVAYIGQILDVDTRTVKVRIALDNARGRLRPGMYASAVLSGAAHEAVTVPAAAVLQDGFKTRVFVERSPWIFESRIVRTGAQIGSQIEIASGLKPGERIVVKDGVLLND